MDRHLLSGFNPANKRNAVTGTLLPDPNLKIRYYHFRFFGMTIINFYIFSLEQSKIIKFTNICSSNIFI